MEIQSLSLVNSGIYLPKVGLAQDTPPSLQFSTEWVSGICRSLYLKWSRKDDRPVLSFGRVNYFRSSGSLVEITWNYDVTENGISKNVWKWDEIPNAFLIFITLLHLSLWDSDWSFCWSYQFWLINSIPNWKPSSFHCFAQLLNLICFFQKL